MALRPPGSCTCCTAAYLAHRERTRSFAQLQSHYLFLDRFGRPGKGNDKGKVEGLVGYARRNYLVPLPEVPSFAALNAHLEQRCLARLDDRLRGHTQSIGGRLERDLDALQPLPASPYDPCDRRPARSLDSRAPRLPTPAGPALPRAGRPGGA